MKDYKYYEKLSKEQLITEYKDGVIERKEIEDALEEYYDIIENGDGDDDWYDYIAEARSAAGFADYTLPVDETEENLNDVNAGLDLIRSELYDRNYPEYSV